MNQIFISCYKKSSNCIKLVTSKQYVPIAYAPLRLCKTYYSSSSGHIASQINFEDTKTAYKSKTTLELWRARFVLKLCSVNVFVENGMKIANVFEKIVGQRMFTFLVKSSFFDHFVAGEYPKDIPRAITSLQKHNINGMINYSVEDDISDGIIGQNNEDKCDELLQTLIECVTETASATDTGFIAIKITALTHPNNVLNKFSDLLRKSRTLFLQFCENEGNLAEKYFDVLLFERQLEKLKVVMTKNDMHDWFSVMDKNKSGLVDFVNWNDLLVCNRDFRNVFTKIDTKGDIENILPILSVEDEAQLARLLDRMDVLSKHAAACNVKMMIDAEQTYFQPAISRITMEMMRKYNKDRTVIMNTYQCYLEETEENVLNDIALSNREEFYFGIKLVRGAYMEQERARAQLLKYKDPIQPNYESTGRNYHKLLTYVLRNVQEHNKCTFLIASHNEHTVKFALNKLNELKLENSTGIYFGQLLGMCDHVTFSLAKLGKQVIKNIPIGPVNEVMPYLHRRALENKSVFQRLQTERKLIRREILRRTKERATFNAK